MREGKTLFRLPLVSIGCKGISLPRGQLYPKASQAKVLDFPLIILPDVFFLVMSIAHERLVGKQHIVMHGPYPGSCGFTRDLDLRHVAVVYRCRTPESLTVVGNNLISSVPGIFSIGPELKDRIFCEEVTPLLPTLRIHEAEVTRLQFLDFLDLHQHLNIHGAPFYLDCVRLGTIKTP